MILVLGTVLIGCEIYNFRYSPYLTHAKRTLVADYALPVSALLMALVGSCAFKEVNMGKFHDDNPQNFVFEEWGEVTIGMVFGSMGVGLMQGFLIFIDQNITASVVNSPSNRFASVVNGIINCVYLTLGLKLKCRLITLTVILPRCIQLPCCYCVIGQLQERKDLITLLGQRRLR